MTHESAPHLLYVAWGFPPSRSGGAYRLLATANAFAAAGWDVTVLTVPREVFMRSTGIDPSLEARVDPRVRVERIPFPHDETNLDLRTWGAFRAHAPELWNGWRGWRTGRVFPEPRYGLWRTELERAAERIHAAKPVSLSIGSANPNVVHTAGFHLHQRYGVPFVMDYRDTWQLDMYSGRRTLTDRSPAAVWERRLVEAAAEVWFVNEPIAQWHRDLYPTAAQNIRVVPNGFDRAFVGDPTPPREGRADGIVFGNIGTMTSQTPIPQLIEAWLAAADDLPGARLDLYGYLGHQGDDEGGVLAQVGRVTDGSARYRGPVAKAAIADVYATLDALILPLGTSRFMTSGKVFEYMATGLPIVSVHDPVLAVSDTLRGYPGWFPAASLDTSDVAEALVKAGAYAATQTLQDRLDARSWADRYERSRILAPVVKRWSEEAASSRSASGANDHPQPEPGITDTRTALP
ncbi:glycosyltransferase family 4 protein [Microbacterium sp. zg.Y909]|uniref:glycosyltransferase family 4 protein n=1 Tax=Microbacterium sp. zg.Y909 TaxID=2969413 RepID=UPI00214BA7A1|nr:glycosyltransferase family 4 protein [Microbacterium sp. zg.Y909]MCR2824037.1 glycosyltransferase family 4 protein [Microbacterium sp. zg.Y909]